MEYQIYLSLGSNIGPRELYLKKALGYLSEIFTFKMVSSLYRTEPQDDTKQDDFLNLCALFFTSRQDPHLVLAETQRIEQLIGRQKDKGRPKGPRAIDIDILLFGSLTVQESGLTIPHESMLQRNFVLVPLREIVEVYGCGIIDVNTIDRYIMLNSSQKVELVGKIGNGGF